MRKFLFSAAVVAATIVGLGCGKTAETGCTPATPASERAIMVAYCNANGINFTEHSSGILYQMVTDGTGANPTVNSTVTVVYTGRLLNGTQFDANATGISFPLSNVIEGWKIAIPLMRVGGRMRMVLPSSLAYSCVGTGGIPPNSPLFFDVTLNAVR